MTTGQGLFCKEFLCFNTIPCRHMPLRSISEISSCFLGPRPWHIKIRHRVKKTSTINLFGFETLKLKIRRLKLWKPTGRPSGGGGGRPVYLSICLSIYLSISLSLYINVYIYLYNIYIYIYTLLVHF